MLPNKLILKQNPSQATQSLIYSSFLENSQDAIINMTLEGIVTEWNKAAELMFGYSSAEIVGEPFTKIFPVELQDKEKEVFERAKAGEKVYRQKCIGAHKSGQSVRVSSAMFPIQDDQGEVISISKIAGDKSWEAEAETIILHQATHDSLTSLPNRAKITQLVEETIHRITAAMLGNVLLLYIDLDHFKAVNDYYGDAVGNTVLIAAAKRIKDCVGSEDIVARFGDDEFMVLLKSPDSTDAAEAVIQNIIDEFKRPVFAGEFSISIHISVGVATLNDRDICASELISQADKALQEVKAKGRNGLYFYDASLRSRAAVNHKLMRDLPEAFEKNQLTLVYQPIVDLGDLSVRKAEALIRWKHPLLGTVSPMIFIPIAEENGMVCQLGSWVFETAVSALANVKGRYGDDFNLSINISPLHLLAKELVPQQWLEMLLQSGLEGNNLTLEITESSLLQNTEGSKRKIKDFKQGKIQIALDDFGTGYSCLGHLNDFEIDYVKIDRSFIKDISTNLKDKLLCEAIIAMAHKLDIMVVAEGIETREQLSLLKDMGCDFGQGYYFARPMDENSFLNHHVAENLIC